MSKKEYLKHEFKQNKRELKPDGDRPPKMQDNYQDVDPYQEQLKEIERRIQAAKGLSESDMRAIEKSLADQDIKKQLFKSRMMMKSDEARQAVKIKEESQARRPEEPLSAKDKFKAMFKSKDKDHER